MTMVVTPHRDIPKMSSYDKPRVISEVKKKKKKVQPVLHDDERTRISGELEWCSLGDSKDGWLPCYVEVRDGHLIVYPPGSTRPEFRLPLRHLNLHPANCRPRAFSFVGRDHEPVATFQARNQREYERWVKTLAVELLRQTPLEAIRFLDILGITATLAVATSRGRQRERLSELVRRRGQSEDSLLSCGSISKDANDDNQPKRPRIPKLWMEHSTGKEETSNKREANGLKHEKTKKEHKDYQKAEHKEKRRNGERWNEKEKKDSENVRVAEESRSIKEAQMRRRQRERVLRKGEDACVRDRRNILHLEEDLDLINGTFDFEDGLLETKNQRKKDKSEVIDKVVENGDDSMNGEGKRRFDKHHNKYSSSRFQRSGPAEDKSNKTAVISAERLKRRESRISKMGRSSSKVIDSDSESEDEEMKQLLLRCQQVENYVSVKEKKRLFESLGRRGRRMARSTDNLTTIGSDNGGRRVRPKKRARSLHDLSRCEYKSSIAVRDICRYFEEREVNPKEVPINIDTSKSSLVSESSVDSKSAFLSRRRLQRGERRLNQLKQLLTECEETIWRLQEEMAALDSSKEAQENESERLTILGIYLGLEKRLAEEESRLAWLQDESNHAVKFVQDALMKYETERIMSSSSEG